MVLTVASPLLDIHSKYIIFPLARFLSNPKTDDGRQDEIKAGYVRKAISSQQSSVWPLNRQGKENTGKKKRGGGGRDSVRHADINCGPIERAFLLAAADDVPKEKLFRLGSDKRTYQMAEDVEVEREIDLKILGQPKTKHRRREGEYEI